MKNILPFVGAFCIVATAAAQQPLSWQILPLTGLVVSADSARHSYDPVRQRDVFLTGWPYGETFEWNGASWSNRGPAACGTREYPGLAFAPQTQHTIVYGGWRYPVMLGDTWRWNGVFWQQLAPTTNPGARRQVGMFLDAQRQSVVMVAGTANNGISPWSPALDRNDTWEWNGSDWVALSPATSPTAGPCLATYDTRRNRGVLFPRFGNTMWEWDGSDWRSITPSQSPTWSASSALTFDPTRGTVLYGNGSWEWDGTDWTSSGSVGGAGSVLPIFFDRTSQRLLSASTRMWGSQNFASQSVATATRYGLGCGSPQLQLEPQGVPLLGEQVSVRVTPQRVTIGGVSTSWVSVGFSAAAGFAWPLPACTWHTTSEFTGFGAYSTGAWVLAIPYDPSLLNFDLYLQGFTFAPGENAASLVLSNGVHWRIGDSR
ncbi:MAG: hypothetical protein MUC36_26295 [Planctomycetes bacterium]|jgi:hypothetical protein|nr:hypothetical protein [Planctomycetota bacterium]